MKEKEQIQKILKRTRFMYFYFLGFLILAIIISLIAAFLQLVTTELDEGPYRTIITISSVLILLISNFFYNKRLQRLSVEMPLKNRIEKMSGAFFVKIAMYEAVALSSLTIFMQSGEYFYLGISGIFLVALVINFPSKRRILKDVPLAESDLEVLK